MEDVQRPIVVTAKATLQVDGQEPIWRWDISSQHNDVGPSMYIMNAPASCISIWRFCITMTYHFILHANKYHLQEQPRNMAHDPYLAFVNDTQSNILLRCKVQF